MTPNTARQLIRDLFDPIVAAQHGRFWCEKTPATLINVERTHQLLPEARFIHIVRDGRDVASSMCERQFWPIAASRRFPETLGFKGRVSFPQAMAYWATMLEIGERQLAAIPQEQKMSVRLEDIVRRELDSTTMIQHFLQLDPDTPLQRPKGNSNLGRSKVEPLSEGTWPDIVQTALSRWGYCDTHAQ